MLHTGGPCDQGLRPEACDLVWIPMYWTPHASRARSASTEPALPVTRFACSQGEIPVASAHREKGRPPQRSRALPCPQPCQAGPVALPCRSELSPCTNPQSQPITCCPRSWADAPGTSSRPEEISCQFKTKTRPALGVVDPGPLPPAPARPSVKPCG